MNDNDHLVVGYLMKWAAAGDAGAIEKLELLGGEEAVERYQAHERARAEREAVLQRQQAEQERQAGLRGLGRIREALAGEGGA